MKLVKVLLVVAVIGLAGAAALIATGTYNVAADDPHWPITERVMETLRARSIRTRAAAIEVPALDDQALIRSGAGNFNSMCVGCHLHPGAADSELSRGLYPSPPRWSELGQSDPREAFWVVKHGVKMSGMPGWGKSMDDQYIWGMVAFMRQFPGMTPARYRQWVASSSGHQHGGGESLPLSDPAVPDMGGGADHDRHDADPPRSSFEPADDPMADAIDADPTAEQPHDHQHPH